MKKTLSLVMVAALILCIFAGCGSPDVETTPTAGDNQENTSDLLSVYADMSNESVYL